MFLAILSAGAVALLATGRSLRPRSADADADADGRTGTRPSGPARPGIDPGLAEPDPRLPPVLLPEKVQPDDIGRLRFSVALRGYRMDQVDAVLARLATALAERDAALAAVRCQQPGARPEEPGTLS